MPLGHAMAQTGQTKYTYRKNKTHKKSNTHVENKIHLLRTRVLILYMWLKKLRIIKPCFVDEMYQHKSIQI